MNAGATLASVFDCDDGDPEGNEFCIQGLSPGCSRSQQDIGRYEHTWRMTYVRGPEGIIVSVA